MIRGITNISTLELQCYLQIKKKYYSLSFLHFNDQSEMSDSEVLINIFKKIMPRSYMFKHQSFTQTFLSFSKRYETISTVLCKFYRIIN